MSIKSFESDYLSSAIKQFQYYKRLGESTFDQLDDGDLHWQMNEEVNSVAMIVQHLWGNMRSRWTNFLETDGEKDWRNRDQEFELVIQDRGEMLSKWEEGWNCLFQALRSVNEENFNTVIYIRNQAHSITEAVNRQMMHYAYHIGQIVYIGKLRKGADWKSLSIPRGKSVTYNQEKFKKGKHGGHFTDHG